MPATLFARNAFTLALLACLAALLSVSAAVADEALGSLLPKDLVGTYSIVESEKGGKPTPRERYNGVLVRFTETSIVATDTEKKEVYAASYRLTSDQNPTKLVMASTMEINRGVEAPGMIERSGDTIRLIYRLPDGKEDPSEFKSRPGQIMVVLKRVAE